MEYCARARAYLAKDLSQIEEGFVEINKLKIWKPIYRMVSTKNALYEALFGIFLIILCIYDMTNHVN